VEVVKARKHQGEQLVFTVSEVAEHLGISEMHVSNMIEEGKLHGIDVGGGTRKFWRIPVTALERFKSQRSSLV
jgi:excisionase family DNA binding protein